MTDRRSVAERWGRLAEFICRWRLRLGGWQILETRFRGGRGTGAGEIDIVARRGNTIAFIEVKARADFTSALVSLTAHQQQRIARAAESYLARHPELSGCDVRFDLMAVAGFGWPRHVKDAWRT